ncbi:carbamoylphosphate synthase large subunit [Arthrobacter sp. V4I6]|uniref:ATP-grasp domain-containing protein n=1 Tax=unclassified Arthrobacter TaxID=235627 RepID=UPI0027880FF9|nr:MULTISPECIES: ATP-grasp domain-containing protein [unclassified Arthrobacter]MDQ0819214.1 carbamoylphosphate synthase large subunit [Arthrobacter sp. V1I7]MDQ0853398.1 carbamoylphosphate synthase large subunit [Arthrobacter sp. V4I6]
MKPRILITGAGAPAGRALAAQLKSRDIPFLGADVRELPVGAGFTAVRVPPATDPEMVPALRRLVARESINLVIPAASEELTHLSAARAGFGRDVRVIIGDPGPVALANDRLFTAWQLRTAGVPVPRCGVPGDFAGADDAMAALDGPVVVRPRVCRGEGSVMFIDGSQHVDWAALPDGQIVQEYIPGTEYLPLVFGTPADNGTAPFVIVAERTTSADGNPGRADGCVRRAVAGEDMDVGNLAMAAVRSLGLTGPVELAVRRRDDGTPVVLDVNARFGASSESAPELLDAVLASFNLPSFNPASFRQGIGAYAYAVV